MDHNKLWKILKKMGIPDHLICLLRNLYAGQEVAVELNIKQWTGSNLGKKFIKAVYCHLLFNLHAEYIMQDAGLDESQAGIKIARTSIKNLRYADDSTLMAENKEELKSFLKGVKEKSEKPDLKLNIQNSKIMASIPITSWQIDGEKVEAVTDFLFLGSRIIKDGDCSHEIQRRLLLGRKYMTNLDNILKSRGITLPTKVHIVKSMICP